MLQALHNSASSENASNIHRSTVSITVLEGTETNGDFRALVDKEEVQPKESSVNHEIEMVDPQTSQTGEA